MGFKKYSGPIETVEHAMMAHLVVTVTCQRCSHWTTMWAWRIYETLKKKEKVTTMPLRKAVDGFRCKGCKHSVQVVIMPGMR